MPCRQWHAESPAPRARCTVLFLAAVPGASGAGELFVVVYDPSNLGSQPFGKQRITAMYRPGGDTYTPVSGIWQSVWMESVPAQYISGLKINADMKKLTITVNSNIPNAEAATVSVKSSDGTLTTLATSEGCQVNMPCEVAVPSPQLWSPEDPFLYNLTVTVGSDSVGSYFGMREASHSR